MLIFKHKKTFFPKTREFNKLCNKLLWMMTYSNCELSLALR